MHKGYNMMFDVGLPLTLLVEEGVAEELVLVARYPHHGHVGVEAGGLGGDEGG